MKKFVALLLAAMMLLAMVACGNDPQPTPDPEPTPEPTVDTTVVDELYAAFDASMAEQLGETPAPNGEKIGAVIISLTNQFWANMKVCYEAAAEKLGVQIDVQTGTTEGDTQSQLDVLMTMADMDYDVIIVSPIDGTNLIPGIVKCNEKGIKVINLGPGVDTAALAEAGGHLDGKITVQFSDQGKIVANDMISRLPEAKLPFCRVLPVQASPRDALQVLPQCLKLPRISNWLPPFPAIGMLPRPMIPPRISSPPIPI